MQARKAFALRRLHSKVNALKYLPAVALGVESLVVHVPQNSNRLFALGLALQHGRLSPSAGLVAQLDFKARWR